MSKIIPATCAGGVVTAEGFAVPGAVVLSEGVGSSEGALILERDAPTYVAKTSPDLKATLEAIVSVLGQLTAALTAIDAKPTGGTASAPTPVATANVAQLTALQSQLTTLKGALR